MKRILRWAGAVVAALLLAALILPLLIDANAFRPRLEAALSAALARDVRVGNLSWRLFSGSVAAADLTIAEDPAFGSEPFLRARALEAGVDLAPLLFSRRLEVRSITLDRPEIALRSDPDGRWNFSSLGRPAAGPDPAPEPAADAAAAPLDFSVDVIRISQGKLTIGDSRPGSRVRALENVNIEVRDFARSASFPFRLEAEVAGGGAVRLDGHAGPIPPQAAETPFDAHLTVEALRLAEAGFTAPESGVNGELSAGADASSDGARIQVRGKASLHRMKLSRKGSPAPQPLEAEFELTHDAKARRGALEQLPVRFGQAAVHITGGYDLTGAAPVVDLRLKGSGVPLTALAPILPALDVVLPAGATIEQGSADVDLASRGTMADLVTTGSVNVTNAVLANFSLSDKLRALQQLAGIKAEPKSTIERLASEFEVAPQGTTVRNVQLVIPSVGEINGSGTISPEHELNLRARATVRAAALLAAVGGEGGSVTIPLLIQGTSSNPSFKADISGVAGGKLKEIVKDPSGALKAAKGILDMFKRAPKQEQPEAKQ
jgi:AsmA protein